MGIVSVLCEGGLTLARSLAAQGLVDQWLTVVAPVVIGSQPIEKVLRGKLNVDESFMACGDSFVTVDFARRGRS